MGARSAGAGVAAALAIQNRFRVAMPTTPREPLNVVDLDAHAGEASAEGDDGKPVVAAADESAYQSETDDIFLKARKTIRLRSNDTVKIAAARSASMRVGSMMMMRVRGDTGGKDEIVLGCTTTNTPTDPGDVSATPGPPFIRVTGQSGIPVPSLAGMSPKIEMVLGDSGPGVSLVLDETSLDYTIGAGTFTINNSGASVRNLPLDINRALTVTV